MIEKRLKLETEDLRSMNASEDFTIDEIEKQKGIVVGLLFAAYYMRENITNEEDFDPFDFYDFCSDYEESEGITLWRE